MNGTLNGKQHTDKDIQNMKDSGRYKKNYRKYQEAKTHNMETILRLLHEWFEKWWIKVRVEIMPLGQGYEGREAK
jgi:hypothetical protein